MTKSKCSFGRTDPYRIGDPTHLLKVISAYVLHARLKWPMTAGLDCAARGKFLENVQNLNTLPRFN